MDQVIDWSARNFLILGLGFLAMAALWAALIWILSKDRDQG